MKIPTSIDSWFEDRCLGRWLSSLKWSVLIEMTGGHRFCYSG